MQELLEKLESVDYELSHFVHKTDGSQWFWSLNDGRTGGYAENLTQALEAIAERSKQ